MNRRNASEKLGVHYHTLYAMAKRGELEAVKIGKQQMYDVEKYLRERNAFEADDRRNICYCRVSSQKQKNDLKRQVELIKKAYPNYEIITDIGSGLNFNRVGLKKIIDYAIKGEINKVVITYKDRMARIGYELIENLIKEYSNGEIIIMNKNEEETPQEEMTKDLIAIMNVYVAKVNGLRKYKKLIKSDIEKEK